MTGPLERRAADLARLADERWDLLIVGGGIVGAGALLDAVSRGLKVALVEQDDIAAGTSSRSSRLIHGGLRYLQQGEIGLVREALAERARLLRLAPHLVRLEAFLFPIYGPPVRQARVLRGRPHGLRPPRLDGSRPAATATWGSTRRWPTRRTSCARTCGARCSTTTPWRTTRGSRSPSCARRIARCAGCAPSPSRASGRGAPAGRRSRDRRRGRGPAHRGHRRRCGRRPCSTRPASGARCPDRPFGAGSFDVLPARGSHLVIERDRIPARGGMTLRIPGRVAFLVPWPRHWIIGTTDKPYRGPLDHVAASAEEVDEILGTLNGALDLDAHARRHRGHVRRVSGRSSRRRTRRPRVKVSREHRVAVEAPGLVRVSGGKYTTYRVMARDAVDAVLGVRRPDPAQRHGRSCRSTARPRARTWTRLPRASPARPGWTPDRGHVARGPPRDPGAGRSSRSAGSVTSCVRSSPATRSSRPRSPGPWSTSSALSLDDLLARRLRLAPVLRDRGEAIAPRVAAIAGGILGWDATRQAAEVSRYLEGARREFARSAAGRPRR